MCQRFPQNSFFPNIPYTSPATDFTDPALTSARGNPGRAPAAPGDWARCALAPNLSGHLRTYPNLCGPRSGSDAHEMAHFADDEAAGFPGLRYWLEDPVVTAAGESKAYEAEIDYANSSVSLK